MKYGFSPVYRRLWVLCALAACTTDNLEPDARPDTFPAQAEGSLSSDTLNAVADAFLRTAAKNSNSGTAQTIPVKILVGEGDTTRAIIKFDQAAIAAAMGSGTLTAASLELRVKESGTDPAGNDIDVHRVLKPWTEAGSTWKCGEDLNTANVGADCPTTKWKMSGVDMDAFVATRTARVHLTSGQTGVARFDVTTDVQAFLAGGTNHGWLVNAASATSRALLWSREASLKPSLVLSVAEAEGPADWPALSELPVLDTTRLVTLPNDTAKLFRTELMVLFDSEVSDAGKQSILTSLGLAVVGITYSGRFFVRFPDRGPSIEAYRAFADSIRARPGIRAVAPINFTPLEEIAPSRYPSDGSGQTRADWFNSSNATWAKRAIRLPQAWGCENGAYGGSPVSVGVLEFKHDRDHPEFSASNPTLWEPDDAQLAKLGISPQPPATVAARVLHATQVVGTLTASGDNGAGVAGVMWKTSLKLYAMYSSGDRPTDIVTGFYQITKQMGDDGIQVLSISADGELKASYTQAEKEAYVELVAHDIRTLLDTSPRLTIILAAGNERFRNTYATYLQTPKPAVIRSALLKIRSEAPHRDRVVVVSGTQQGNMFWNSWYLDPTAGASFFSGLTDIAAPAQDIVTLDRRTGSSVPVTGPTIAGTSLSAPMVAGVAAQLLSMDPALTPTQVKDYILRGAQLPTVDPASGVLTAVNALAGAPETVYELDAYGSLSLLSRERQGTPICGFPATLELPQSGPRVRLARNGSNSETIAVNGISGYQVDGLSVAQGGRLFAVGQVNFEPNTPPTPMEVNEYALANGQWSVRRTIPDVAVRTYLEKDTVDSDNFSGFFGTRWTLRGPRWGTGTTLRLAETTQPYLTPTTTPFYPFTYPYTYGVEFSPDGAFAVVRTRLDSPPCPNYQDQMWLVTLPNGPVQALLPTQCDGEGPRDAAWDPSSSRFILAELGANGVTYQARRIISGVAQADGPGITIPDRFPADYSIGAEGHSTDPSGTTATWLELVQNGCYLTTRTTSTFALVSEQLYPYSNSDWLGFCQVPVQMLRTKPGSVTLRH